MNTQTIPITTSTGTDTKPVDLKLEVVVLPVSDAGRSVSAVFHGADALFGSAERKSGAAPQHATYQSFVSSSDPDGNGWLLQEVNARLPGRVAGASFARAHDLAEALQRAAEAHGEHEERNGGEYDEQWPDWDATYTVGEQAGTELPT